MGMGPGIRSKSGALHRHPTIGYVRIRKKQREMAIVYRNCLRVIWHLTSDDAAESKNRPSRCVNRH